MSDYLWDKTGDGDADVERLEELLGAFGHRPRELELPTTEAAPPPRPALLHSRRFRPALLTAAALLLMMLAGALVVLRQNGTGDADSSRQAVGRESKAAPPRKEFAAPREEFTPIVEPERGDERAAEHDAPMKKAVPPDFRQANLKERRQKSPGVRGAGSNQEPRRVLTAQAPGVAAQKESTAPSSPERQAAKERLVYALRLASAKLNEVRRMTRGDETLRHASQERNRTR
ncbi:MAG: hypothetical protein H0T60_06860 [Acidobacteria bacterium]|nr:hypothetical protein [Acidobacteriota bacterium]